MRSGDQRRPHPGAALWNLHKLQPPTPLNRFVSNAVELWESGLIQDIANVPCE